MITLSPGDFEITIDLIASGYRTHFHSVGSGITVMGAKRTLWTDDTVPRTNKPVRFYTTLYRDYNGRMYAYVEPRIF